MATEILIPLEGVSPTGLQAKELMGLTVNAINELTDSDASTFQKYYEELYLRSYRALEVDAQKILSGFYTLPDGTYINGKFNINRKVGTLLTGRFLDQLQTDNGLAGVNVYWTPSLYNALNVQYVYINVTEVINSTVSIVIVDNLTGLPLSVTNFDPVMGVNKVPIFFDVELTYNFTVGLTCRPYALSKPSSYFL